MYPFIYTVKACQWNLINSSKFANDLIKKEKKYLCRNQWEKEKMRKVGLYLCFIKSFNMIINLFFCFASSFAAQIFLFDCKMTQEISEGDVGNGKWLGMANYNIHFKNQSFSNEHNRNKFSLVKKICM